MFLSRISCQSQEDGQGNMALPLMLELLEYGYQHCEITILEGIFRFEWYKALERTKSIANRP